MRRFELVKRNLLIDIYFHKKIDSVTQPKTYENGKNKCLSVLKDLIANFFEISITSDYKTLKVYGHLYY